ncbi:MAG: pitrilysin family protein [Acidobacteriota bacterium]
MIRRPIPFTPTELLCDNGLRVVVLPTPSRGLVSLWTIVRAGSRDEAEDGLGGFAHFFEHMMFRGSERFPADVYNREMTRLGADVNAFTSTDLTAYHVTLLPADLDRALEIEADRFANLSYDEQAFRDEAGAVWGEYLKGLADPWFALEERLLETAFRVHPYGHTVIGPRRDLERMPELFETSREFYRRYYTPDNAIVLLVGDVERDRGAAMVRERFGGWRGAAQPVEVPVEPAQDAPRQVTVRFAGRSLPLVWIGCRMPAFDPASEPVAAAVVLAEAGFGRNAPLWRRLVVDERRAIRLEAWADLARDPRLFHVRAAVRSADDVGPVVDAIEDEMRRLADAPPDGAQLDDVRSHLLAGLRLRLESPGAVGMTLAPLLALAGGLDAVNRFWEQVLSVDAATLGRCAATLFDPAGRTVARLEEAP